VPYVQLLNRNFLHEMSPCGNSLLPNSLVTTFTEWFLTPRDLRNASHVLKERALIPWLCRGSIPECTSSSLQVWPCFGKIDALGG
jgi:hypothetical protein